MKIKYKNGCLTVDFEGMTGFVTKSHEALQDMIDQFEEAKLRMKKDAKSTRKQRRKVPRGNANSTSDNNKRRRGKLRGT